MGRKDSPLRFVLYPMVHMGLPRFYGEVARRLRGCDLIVAEGADAASSTGMAYAIALKVTLQWGSKGLVHQDIDYAALGVPVIFPENLVKVKRRRFRMLWLEWLTVIFFTPVLIVTNAVGGRGHLMRQGLEVSDDQQARIRFMTKAMIDDRDAELIAALAEIHERRRLEPINVAVVYGAAHLPAVVRALSDLGYRARSAEWLDVLEF